MEKILLSPPHVSGREMHYLREVIDSNWIAPAGPHLHAFEKRLSACTGRGHALALASGTAAIHLALLLLGVKKGDVVICQSLTFTASVNPVVYLGATPVFIDSEADTWNICPEHLEAGLKYYSMRGKRPKAVIGVHIYGMPARLDEVLGVCEKYGVPFVEDAAEALGAVYRKKKAGSFGALSILSFNGNKIITASAGGALLADRGDYISKGRYLASQAKEATPYYQHLEIGYNYIMSNVCAAVGLAQLEILELRVAQRRRNFAFYADALGATPGISFQSEPEGVKSNRWLTALLIDPAETGGVTRETVRLYLGQQGVETRPVWKPMHLQPVFRGAPFWGGRTAEQFFRRGLCLPSGSNLTESELGKVCRLIMESIRGRHISPFC